MSNLEESLALQIRGAKLPPPKRQYMAVPGRRWRWDFAWLEERVLVEVQGGTYIKGGHVRGAQYAKDAEKMNAAALLGFTQLWFTTEHIRTRYALDTIEAALVARGWKRR